MNKYYIQHEGKVIEANDQFKHVMAITLNPKKDYKEGIVRCIISREGDVQVKGYTDRSELFKISSDSLEQFKIGERLNIKNKKEIIDQLVEPDWEFIGLEDPDIYIDEKNDLMHVYFTIPIKYKDKSKKIKIHLGHAVGKDLDSLEMTMPVLLDIGNMSAKEVSIVPINKNGFRYNLIESRDKQGEATYSVVQVAIVKDMDKDWEYGNIVFHPREHNIPWIGGHASPGPLFPKSFIDVGEGKLLGVINGREANQKMSDGSTKYGMFSIGLFIYDYEIGKIDWISPEPFIQDSEAITITFASQFVETSKGGGVLYAHVDDSFVRAYDLKVDEVKQFLKYNNYEIKN
ncbi:MAG: hypothetical protein UR85_C0002G0024 [Candidatus Nomurabacteria bacterium GW2011_GWF2_35_66]|uniref:Glycosidase-related protein n=1 Tax=Candidatus Nomurabacteria bacterium GW2011_GWE1_35_16 TaxID=1618761 RepID=A0A0G0BS77_9BACT|nr:MAG: hypothetical protein UR55_C0007G0018 [Candidatus Nomurabacteria bacterium GW2011_GWF1_34_20]KKP63293.1 MAG: hypothetical protein UR57_C0006G0018 [Candidatus Nomurabacteria bacterium GW2011_GWE2_34_25]KKP66491.1 MAG: hypothetical protein UR64_C0006G0018 [Candidatus Nomurabacteria bacterium GW2011_GWE1_35_16]KKP83711.1 MAG: hypothetical protein UR85_C0002G0024 [Candidatus Nomurabacteria bacterium GW2011_GWF2_35_66]